MDNLLRTPWLVYQRLLAWLYHIHAGAPAPYEERDKYAYESQASNSNVPNSKITLDQEI